MPRAESSDGKRKTSVREHQRKSTSGKKTTVRKHNRNVRIKNVNYVSCSIKDDELECNFQDNKGNVTKIDKVSRLMIEQPKKTSIINMDEQTIVNSDLELKSDAVVREDSGSDEVSIYLYKEKAKAEWDINRPTPEDMRTMGTMGMNEELGRISRQTWDYKFKDEDKRNYLMNVTREIQKLIDDGFVKTSREELRALHTWLDNNVIRSYI